MIIDRIQAARERDPAARGFWGVIEIVLTYSGFHALLFHDVAHLLRVLHVPLIPRIISQLARFLTGIEIHPGARIGKGVFIDHGMGIVIGETAEIGEGTTLFQGVTLGGTGKQAGKRHPTVGKNVVIGVGAAVLGNVIVGDGSYIGAGAVVLKDVPPNSTAVGVPARIVKMEGRRILGATLDHASLPDPIVDRLQALQDELERTEEEMQVEMGLPHVALAVESEDRTAAREAIERMFAARRLPYGVHEREAVLRISTTMCERDYQCIRMEIGKCGLLSVVSEGREADVRGRSVAESEGPRDADAVIKVVVTVTTRAR